MRTPRFFGGGRTVGTTRWSHYRPSALLVAGLLFLMFGVTGLGVIATARSWSAARRSA